MTAERNIVFWRLCVSVQLIAAVLVVTLGAQSAAFHSWMHGDDVICSLTHHSGGPENCGDDSSEDPRDDDSDPLEPFCQAGYLLQVMFPDVEIVLPLAADGVEVPTTPSFPTEYSSLFDTRGPPALI